MSGQPGGTNVTTRKKRRGMIEKRRRDKINNSLCELRRLVPAAFEKQGSAKLEKAEILQMTVDYLRMLHAKGLADSLTTNKHSTSALHLNEDSTTLSQAPSPNKLTLTAQLQQHPQQASQNSNDLTNLTSVQHQPIIQQHTQPPAQPVTPQIQHSNNLHSGITSTPINPSIAMTGGTPSSQSIHNSSTVTHHHLYNQHHMSVAVEHAAAAYHHLSNPLSTTDMSSMMSHSSGSATQYYHPHPHHHQQQQQQQDIKHHIKMESHQPPLVISHSHPSLLNLDHHHHHHQTHNHSHNHPFSAHYGPHHHHPHSGASLKMNPYLAATAAAAAAYPMSAVSIATSQVPAATNHIDTLHCQSAMFDQQQQQTIQHDNSGSDDSQVQQHLTQVNQSGGAGSSSPSANDTNGHQQVSSSSSPSNSTSNTSTSAQRHYRPWGTELAY